MMWEGESMTDPDQREAVAGDGDDGVFPILKTPGYAACSRASMCFCSYSIGVS